VSAATAAVAVNTMPVIAYRRRPIVSMVAQGLWYNAFSMVEPRIVPRAEHAISRRDIDPDALKVLYRLRQFEHVAYLVGGSVRDLLLGRRPKDFDIGTSAHPYQVKKLFRNCWIIGRRFRLAHVKFGAKIVEVATFRRQVEPGEEVVQDGVPAPEAGGLLVHHDNTFGTPEEDAFRRDFTINALFYDIATFSVIDYVGGLEDLRAGVVRAIGDPEVRLREDPVRMLRAVALASRLDFAIDPPVLDAIRKHRHEIAHSSPPRVLEEYFKMLRAGCAEKSFRWLAELGLLEPISAELHQGATERLWRSLAELDAYRRRHTSTPDTLTNPILVGSLIVPLGIPLQEGRTGQAKEPGERGGPRRPAAIHLRELPLARRDIDRLRQILGLQRRLRDLAANQRAGRALAHRNIFRDALTWLEIHGGSPDVVEQWKTLLADGQALEPADVTDESGNEKSPIRRRRRRRRRRFRPVP
jgi:poly(A) polymerase